MFCSRYFCYKKQNVILQFILNSNLLDNIPLNILFNFFFIITLLPPALHFQPLANVSIHQLGTDGLGPVNSKLSLHLILKRLHKVENLGMAALRVRIRYANFNVDSGVSVLRPDGTQDKGLLLAFDITPTVLIDAIEQRIDVASRVTVYPREMRQPSLVTMSPAVATKVRCV
jgi:hypothetical protein